MKQIICFMLCLFLFTGNVNAQEKPDTLVGLIINQKGKAVKNVRVTGSNFEAVSTNSKGIFVLTGRQNPDSITLVFPAKDIHQVQTSGHNFIKIVINNRKIATVSPARDEIIQTGYGKEKKSRRTTSSSSMTGNELLATGETDLIRAIAGKIPGVTLAFMSDGRQTLRIRGATSINEEDSSPLFVVEGAITDNPGLINLNDIERVDILKDGSIYGAKGANGAVVITMKH